MHADVLICIEVKNVYFSFGIERTVVKSVLNAR